MLPGEVIIRTRCSAWLPGVHRAPGNRSLFPRGPATRRFLPGVRGSRAIPREPFRPPATCPPGRACYPALAPPDQRPITLCYPVRYPASAPGGQIPWSVYGPGSMPPGTLANFLRPLPVIVTRRYHYPAFESRVTVFLSYPASYPAWLPGVHPAPGNRLYRIRACYPESYPARLPGVSCPGSQRPQQYTTRDFDQISQRPLNVIATRRSRAG